MLAAENKSDLRLYFKAVQESIAPEEVGIPKARGSVPKITRGNRKLI